MAYRDLRDFIRKLEKEGELKRISAEVDPVLEITEITDRVTKAGGPALLFEHPKGSKIPLLINMLGSERRMNLALEVDKLSDVADRIQSYLAFQSPQGLLDKLKMLPKLAEIGAFFPKSVKNGPCKEVIRKDNFSLFEFPVLKCWPRDGGRFITWPLVITKNPETGKRNVGLYRMQVEDERTTGMHWQTQKHGAEHFRMARSRHGEGKLEVAVAIGADPVTCLAGALPIPPDLDEMMFAGFLRREPVEMVPCETLDLEVPANAEIVLEGTVDLNEFRTEGPFGDHTGFYSLEGDYPVFRVHCVTHRKDPIYLATIVGPPPQEDFFIGHAIERIFLPVMKMQYPEIADVAMPAEGIFHNLMIISIRKSYPGHARKIMNAIWSLGQAMFTKVIVVVDHDVDVHNSSEVVWKALCAIDPERDIQFTLGPVDTLDHAARMQDFGSKMGIDATRKWPSEGFARPWPDEIKMDPAVKARIDQLWKSLGL
ncbi:MAG: menaquinone biosynthesis decarboxylase [Acidobacteria bacterium]|nr:menaquinone biosynthesis decarboxylase [Acidobacteriota bacterium]MBI3662854.1 menaquinone biosynthesis decarboxylase [Acidobacteriota bacterium]